MSATVGELVAVGGVVVASVGAVLGLIVRHVTGKLATVEGLSVWRSKAEQQIESVAEKVDDLRNQVASQEAERRQVRESLARIEGILSGLSDRIANEVNAAVVKALKGGD